MHLSAPKFKWEWNITTIATMLLLAATLVGWGYMLAEFRSGQASQALSIAEIRAEVRRVEEATRRYENHELRIVAVERQAGEASQAMRAVEQAINSLASDMRLTREILERLERSQRGGQTP